jgi:hypothetical protein
MNQLTDKVRLVERDIAEEKGQFNLFALLEREDLSDRWDLVMSAPWAKQEESTLRYIVDVLKRHLEPSDMTFLARIVILDATRDPVRAINENYSVEHGRIELNDPAQFGLPVKHGYIITSRRAA